ncbi:HSF1 protein, partial [Rhynochetos jubatus]|nr:HSF1 protein [Rhynochetos jubatus]
SPQLEESSPGNPGVEPSLFPSTFIDSILQENKPGTTTAADGDGPAQPQPPEKCLSVACLDKNELNDHLDTIDSNLDNLQTMLTTHGFSVDTSALLDIQDLLSSQEQQKPTETEATTADTGTVP